MKAIPTWRSFKVEAMGAPIPTWSMNSSEALLRTGTLSPSDIDGAYWTGVGICAHQSAMEGGVVKRVPVFE